MRHLLVGFFILFTAIPVWAEVGDDQLEMEAHALLKQELKADSVTDNVGGQRGPSAVDSERELSTSTSTETGTTLSAKTKESEIPVLTKEKAAQAKTESPFTRIIISLGIIGVVGIGLMFAAKRFGWKKNQETAKTQIKVLTQHHLGPKKSLAIIRVAGESILIGITDQNISLIKPLALLDEELAEMNGNQSFDTAMSEFSEQEEEFSFGNVQDRVSLRMKELRKM